MRRIVMVLSVVLMLGIMAVPASAHVLTVEPPGGGSGPNPQSGAQADYPWEGVWVGGPLLGEYDSENPHPGLVQGGPGGAFLMPPSHVKGLNTACESLEGQDNGSVADIRGPGPGPGLDLGACPHGE